MKEKKIKILACTANIKLDFDGVKLNNKAKKNKQTKPI